MYTKMKIRAFNGEQSVAARALVVFMLRVLLRCVDDGAGAGDGTLDDSTDGDGSTDTLLSDDESEDSSSSGGSQSDEFDEFDEEDV